MTIKQFIAWVFICSTNVLYAQKEIKPLIPEVGIVSYTYRNSFQIDVSKTLDTIKALGIHEVEFSNLFGKTAEDIRQMLDERDMICPSFGVSYDDLIGKTDEVALKAKALGANYVRVAWIPHKPTFTFDHVQKAVNDFNRVGKILKEQYGLTFCYHNHGYEFQPYEKGTFFDYIVAHTDPKFVSFEMDILWVFHPGADPVKLLMKYPDRFKLMHVKDLKKGVKGDFTGGTDVDNDVAVGTGQLDIPAILKAAQKTSIQHYFIEDESSSISTQVPQSIAYLKNMIK